MSARAGDEMSGAERLRAIVAWIDYQPEYFNDRFSAEELIRLWKYGRRHDGAVAEFADSWTEDQIREALSVESDLLVRLWALEIMDLRVSAARARGDLRCVLCGGPALPCYERHAQGEDCVSGDAP